MTKLGALFWVTLVAMAGFGTFKVKYAVQDCEDQLNRLRKQTTAEQQEIRVLTAEWTFLNQPERLVNLNPRILRLAPIATKQLQGRIEDIPLRAVPAEPDALIAASPEPAVPPTPPTGLPVATAALRSNPDKPALPVQLARANVSRAPRTLDSLIAQIAEAR